MTVQQSHARAGANRPRQERRLTFGLAGVVWLAVGFGLCAEACAVYEAQNRIWLAQDFLWIAIIVPFVIHASVLLAGSPSPLLRQVTVSLVGLYPTILYRTTSPLVLSSYDEHLHERSLVDLLHGSGLFAPNPMLPIAPYYPGLELFTGMVTRLTEMPVMLAMNLVVLLCRLLFVLTIYFIAITVLRSERAASLVVILYATSPEFFRFNSMFSYQTMALTLGMGGLLLLRRAQFETGLAARRLTLLAILAFVATTMTHHLTSWLFFGFLLAWAITSPPNRRKVVIKAAAVMGASIVAWTAAIASQLTGYLGPVFGAALQEVSGTVAGTSQGHVFSSQGGYVTPEWEKLILLFYAVMYTIAAIIFGGIVLLRAVRSRELSFCLLGLLTLTYPATLAAHFVSAAADIGNRASTFLFLPLALCCALVLMNVRRPRQPRGDRGSPRLVLALIVLTSAAYLGGVILDTGPYGPTLPGPYLVSADGRSQDPLTLAAVRWAISNVPPGSRIVADRVPSNLLSSQARLWPIIEPVNGFEPADLYFSQTWGPYQTNIVKKLDIEYIYVDQRLDTSLPVVGFYFYQGETPGPQRITSAELAKFSHVPGLKVVYHLGPVTIYSTAGMGVAQVRSGFTGDRSMGLGFFGDFVLGLLAVALIFMLRSRLRWVAAAARDAGVIGSIVAIMAVTIMLAAVLFGLCYMPGPGFSVGVACAAIVWVAVGRQRGHAVRLPRISLPRQVDPLAVLGVLAGIAALLVALHLVWSLDITQVNTLLRGASK